MPFKPKFPSYRERIVGLAICFAVYGAALLLAGHDPCHQGRHAIALAVILSALAILPEFPGPKAKAEKYHLGETP
jgi:hypothetical protein